jgi:hypothetical protein
MTAVRSYPIAVDANAVYLETASLDRVSLLDFSSTSLVASVPTTWTHANGWIYYEDNTAKKELWRMPESGGTATLVEAGLGYASSICATDTTAFVADGNNSTIFAASVTSGGFDWSVAAGQRSPSSIVTDGARVYWSNRFGDSLMSVPVSGGTPTLFASGQTYPNRLVIRDGYLYWLNEQGSDSIQRSPLDVPKAQTVVTSSVAGRPSDLAVDGAYVYWTDYGYATSRILKATVQGASPVVLVNPPGESDAIAVDDACVYYSVHDWPSARDLVGRMPK